MQILDLVMMICLAASVGEDGQPKECKVVRVPMYYTDMFAGTVCSEECFRRAPRIMSKYPGWFLLKWRCGARLEKI